MTTATASQFSAAFDAFMRNADRAILKSTTASHSGGKYVTELFRDGSHRVLWSGQIGSGYRSPGLLIDVPTLDLEAMDEDERQVLESEDYDSEQADLFFGGARRELRRRFEYKDEMTEDEFYALLGR